MRIILDAIRGVRPELSILRRRTRQLGSDYVVGLVTRCETPHMPIDGSRFLVDRCINPVLNHLKLSKSQSR
ncbi:hypothetical protein J2X43_003502 [Rhizobium sp. BE258]|nr:hypothetical protein [Rhizobium sp. BE258]